MNPEGETPLKQIRTFQGDIAEALKQKQESVVSLTERERARIETRAQAGPAPAAEPSLPSRRFSKNILLVNGAAVLLALGSYGAWYAYSQYQVKTALPTVATPENRFIAAQSIFVINTDSLDRATLINAIRTKEAAKIAPGAVLELDLREGEGSSAPLTSTEHFLIRGLEAEAPASLVRAFDPLTQLGLLGDATGGAPHTFLIVKLDSFENAFPGMLDWEPTLARDMLPLFASDATIASATTSNQFSDVTIQNKDARVLKDEGGQTLLLYSFYDNNYLIMTDNETSLRTLVKALDAAKLQR